MLIITILFSRMCQLGERLEGKMMIMMTKRLVD